MGKKVYAVRKGRQTGIFASWAECQQQVTGFSGAEYKSFTAREQAERFLLGEGKGKEEAEGLPFRENTGAEKAAVPCMEDDTAAAYVDGSFDKRSGNFSYGMVLFYRGQEKYFCQRFEDRELAAMHNVAGEIKGAEAAMRYAVSEGIKKLVIYHDYEGIAKWCNGAWKANKEGTKAYQAYYESVCRQVEITFVKVKGHSNDTYNDMADALAKQALGLGTATESSASALLPVESVLP
jgi:ribonuclease HI